jgi:hypothetical protein
MQRQRHRLHFFMLAACGALFGSPALAASTERVSVSSAEAQSNATSSSYSISANGRFVAFYSSADNLVPNDTNSAQDIFVRDRQLGTTQRVSVSSSEQQANAASTFGAISADGRYVAFYSSATNLVIGDTNNASDIFVRDRQTGTTERVSVDSAEAQGNATSDWPWINADGRFVVFHSVATNLVADDTNTAADIFVRDRLLGTTERISVNSEEEQGNADSSVIPWISGDGRFVSFGSVATNLVADDTNGWRDAFLRDRLTATTERVSIGVDEEQGNAPAGDYTAVSGDGRYVAFSSSANNLIANDTNNLPDVFVRDRQVGTTLRVSVSGAEAQGNASSGPALALSPDGRFVFFPSSASNLVPDDTNGPFGSDSFLRDRQLGTTERLSVSTAGDQGNGPSGFGGITPDGRFAAFISNASTLVSGDTNSQQDVFVRDRGPQPEKPANDLLADFGGIGLSQRMNDRGWFKVHAQSPLAVATGDLDGDRQDEAIASFSGLGLLARYNNRAPWVTLHTFAALRFVAGDFDGNGIDDLAVDRGATGIWVRYNNADPWRRVSTATSQLLAVGDVDGNGKDELIADRGATGLWVRYNNSGWFKRHATSPVHVLTGDLDGDGRDELIADLGATGIWARYNNAEPWVQLNATSSQGLTTGDLDGEGKDDLAGDFGAAGIEVRYNNLAAWQPVDPRSPLHMVAADLNKSGKDELVAGFSGMGIWARYENASWQRISNASEQGIAAGGFD